MRSRLLLRAAKLGAKKLGAITWLWMMAPNPSGGAVLGRYHPGVIPRTITGITRTMARKAQPTAKAAGTVRSFEMATRDISIAMKNNRMRREGTMSQINRHVALEKCALFKSSQWR